MKIVHMNPDQAASVEKISESFETMKEGVGELAHQIKDETAHAASVAKEKTYDAVGNFLSGARKTVSSDFESVKSYIKREPVKGLAFAFLAGVLLNGMLRKD